MQIETARSVRDAIMREWPDAEIAIGYSRNAGDRTVVITVDGFTDIIIREAIVIGDDPPTIDKCREADKPVLP